MSSRRDFLQASAGFFVYFYTLAPASAKHLAPPPMPTALAAWLVLKPDGSVEFKTGKVDLGTGTVTALRQLIADELDAPLESVSMISGITDQTPDQGPTWGSTTISQAGLDLRYAAATLRQALAMRASIVLVVPVADLVFRRGKVFAPTTGKVATFAELAATSAIDLPVDRKLALKPVTAMQIAGTSVQRPDIAKKVAGRFQFIQDVQVRGMLHGRVMHPPRLGARLVSVDDRAARQLDPSVRIVREKDLIGVVAPDEWLAVKAYGLIKTEWSGGKHLPAPNQVFNTLRATVPAKVTQVLAKGDVAAGRQRAAISNKATYHFPYQSHGSIGPSCGLADVTAEGVTLWSAGQAPHWLRDTVAAALSLPQEKVKVIYVEGSGCYGRNGHEDAVADALMLSRAVGKPVRVQWMRHDEHTVAPRGPAHIVDIEGGVDEKGHIAFLRAETWAVQLPARLPPVAMPALKAAGIEQDENLFAGNTLGNFAPSYSIEPIELSANHINDMPVRVSWIRGPGRVQNVFANESFMDELADMARVEPAQFRLRHLTDARGRASLERVLKLARWEPGESGKLQGGVRRGRGLAYCKYSNATVYVAMVADVAVDEASGMVKLERAFMTHDCGFMVNPDGVLNQVQGQIIQAASRALLEEVRWDAGAETSVDWNSYPILRHLDTPEIVVDLVPSAETPWGVGEPATAVVPAAIANAIHAASGIRLREAPFTPQRVLAALKQRN